MSSDDWRFAEPRNAVAFTCKSVVSGYAPILVVQHLRDDEGWTFLDSEPFDVRNALLVTMDRVVRLDSSLQQLSDLPEGWVANRVDIGAPWRREPDDV
jgi:hypothetical protein